MATSEPTLRTASVPTRRVAVPHHPEADPVERRTLADRVIGSGFGWFLALTVVAIGLAGLMSAGMSLGDVWVWVSRLLDVST